MVSRCSPQCITLAAAPSGTPAFNVGSGDGQVVQDFVHSDLGRAASMSRAMLRPKGGAGGS